MDTGRNLEGFSPAGWRRASEPDEAQDVSPTKAIFPKGKMSEGSGPSTDQTCFKQLKRGGAPKKAIFTHHQCSLETKRERGQPHLHADELTQHVCATRGFTRF